MSMIKCGVASVSFRDKSPEDILKAAKNANLHCVEWGSDVHAPCDDTDQINEIAALQKKYGIYCSSYGTYFKLGRDSVSDLQKYIDAAKLLGTDVLRVWCGEKAPYLYTDDEREELYAQCVKAAEIAKKSRVVLCMECHHHTYTETVEGMLDLMKAIDSHSFRMYWQVNQYVSQEVNLYYALCVAPYCRRVHILHYDEGHKLPLSNGAEVWTKYAAILNNADAFLLEFLYDDNIESLKAEADTLFGICSNIN